MELCKKSEVIQINAKNRMYRYKISGIPHLLRVPDDGEPGISEFLKYHHDEATFANMLYKNTQTYVLKKEIVDSLFQDRDHIRIDYKKIRNMMNVFPISYVENNPSYYIVRLRFLIYEGTLNFPLIYKGPSSIFNDVGLDIYFRPQRLYYIKDNPRFILHDYIENIPKKSHLEYWYTIKDNNCITIVYELYSDEKLVIQKNYRDRYTICTNQQKLKEIINNKPSLISDKVMMTSFKLKNMKKNLL